MKDYAKLEELLGNESYPHVYLHKFIGANTPAFLAGVAQLEKRFPRATKRGSRESNDARGGAYLALTFEFTAHSAPEIIELLKFTAALPDLKIIL